MPWLVMVMVKSHIFVTHATQDVSVNFSTECKKIQMIAKNTALCSVYPTSDSALFYINVWFYTPCVILHPVYNFTLSV